MCRAGAEQTGQAGRPSPQSDTEEDPARTDSAETFHAGHPDAQMLGLGVII